MKPDVMMSLGVLLIEAATERIDGAEAVILRRAPKGLRKVATDLADDVGALLDGHPELGVARPISRVLEDGDWHAEIVGLAPTVFVIVSGLRGLLLPRPDPSEIAAFMLRHAALAAIDRPSEYAFLGVADLLRLDARTAEAERIERAVGNLIAAGGWSAVEQNREAAQIWDGLKAEADRDGE